MPSKRKSVKKRKQPARKSAKGPVTERRPNKFGGRATAVGVGYEAKIAAYIAVKMLAGDGSLLWKGVSGDDVVAVTMQDAAAVDDVVLELDNESASKVLISAKYRAATIQLTKKSVVFTDVIGSFVRQFSQSAADTRSSCYLVWAVPSSAGRKVTHDLRGALNTFREDDFTSLSEFLKRRQTREHEAMCALYEQSKQAWKQTYERMPTDAELCEFIQQVHVEVFDFGDGVQSDQLALQTIRGALAEKPTESQRILEWLYQHFGANNERGLRRTAATLRQLLTNEARIKLKSALSFADDIAFLEQLTERNLERLKDHTLLHFPNTEIHIDRTEDLAALVGAAKGGNLLVTGEPGSGKSGLIHPLVKTLIHDGVPTILLLAEEIFGKAWNGLPSLPGLKRPLDDVLANWPNGTRGILVTDALDAVRDVETQKLLRGLLQDVQKGRSGWNVVASVREFDLKHGRELREMFPGKGVEEHTSNDFAGVAHFHIAELTDAQLDELTVTVPQIGPFIATARTNLRSAGSHRSPFFLRLAAELLRAGVSAARLADWSSPAVLLRRFWDERLHSGTGASARQSALHSICGQMVELRRMTLSLQEVTLGVPERDAITELRSRGILQSPTLKHGSTIGGGELRFSHHLLHDYAVARSLIPDTSAPFLAFAIRNPLLPIFYRQSFLLALEELWDSDDSRAGFWDVALKLESVSGLHGVSRNLAPILAGRRVDVSGDLQPLANAVDASTSEDSSAEKALRHMALGLQDVADDAIRAGAGAWCGFAEKIASLLADRPSLEPPLVHIIARLNIVCATFPDDSLRHLNAAARDLLDYHVSKEVAHCWRYAGLTASEALCRTYRVAPADTESVFFSMLKTERLTAFPHWDLFDLAHQIKHLGEYGDSVVIRLFEAAFSTEPDTNEWENFGGQIMPLRMQTSDNWNSIHYSLSVYYQTKPGTNAGLMTELACIAWNAASRRHEQDQSEDRVIASFVYRGVECPLVEDYGHIWGRRHEHEENQIVTRFETLLDEWATAGDTARMSAALDRFVTCNRSSEMWSIFLTAGAKHTQTLGLLLEPVLQESIFLTHPDYQYSGVRFLSALHKSGDIAQRERLEQMILEFPKTARFLHDEPREPLPDWLKDEQNKLLSSIDEANIVTPQLLALRSELQSEQLLPVNREQEDVDKTYSTLTEEESLKTRVVNATDKINSKLNGLQDALKPFIESDGNSLRDSDLNDHWPIIGQCERAIRRHRKTHPQKAQELWAQLANVCESIATIARWPAQNARWKTVRRILLTASNDLYPKIRESDKAEEEHLPVFSRPAPRIDAAQGLPFLALRLGQADKQVASALLRLCRDKSYALRFSLARRVAVLSQVAPELMWQLIDYYVRYEKRFWILDALVHSLNRLWEISAADVILRLGRIAKRARVAPESHNIHKSIAEVYFFRFLRTGDARCEKFTDELIMDCDSVRANHSLATLPGACRMGKWLIVGDPIKVVDQEEAIRKRTWTFLRKLQSTAQAKLRQHQEIWQQFHADGKMDTEDFKQTQEAINRTVHLVDNIAMQLYFASGAYADKQDNDEDKLSESHKMRFWNEASENLRALANAIHPHTAYHLVQTLEHLLACAPREVFLVATRAITSSSAAGFQHESLAVSEVVNLIQRALADHRDIFHSEDDAESECLVELLKVLDLFVEAGWTAARQLTYRLEEIYR